MGFLDSLKKLFSGMTAGGGDYYQKNFGLAVDEKVLSGGAGYFDPDVSKTASTAAAAASLLAGGEVRVVGQSIMFVITDKGRLVLGMFDGRQGDSMAFGPDHKPSISDTKKFGDRGMIGPTGKEERTKILSVVPKDGEGFRIIVPESLAGSLLGWSSGA
jgi:hypothetical protein